MAVTGGARQQPQDERNCDPNDVTQGNGNPFKVRYVKDTNFVSGMKVERESCGFVTPIGVE